MKIFVVTLVNKMGEGISNIGGTIVSAAQKVWDSLHLEDLLKRAVDLGKGIADNIVKGLTGAVQAVEAAGGGVAKGVTDFFGNLLPKEAQGMQTPGPSTQTQNTTQSATGLSGGAGTMDKVLEQQKQAAIAALKPQLSTAPTIPGGTNSTPTSQPTVRKTSGQQQQQGFQQVAFTQPSGYTGPLGGGTGGGGGGGGSGISAVTSEVAKLNQELSNTPKVAHSAGDSFTSLSGSSNAAAAAAKQQADTAKQVTLNQGYMDAQTKALGGDTEKLQQQIIGNALALGSSTSIDTIKTAGIMEQVVAQQTLEGANIKGAAGLQKYDEQIANGTRQNAEYTAGVIEQGTTLNDLIAANAHAAGANETFAQQLTTTKGLTLNSPKAIKTNKAS